MVAASKNLVAHPPPKQQVAHKAVKRAVLQAAQPVAVSKNLVAHPTKQLVAHKAVKVKPSSDLIGVNGWQMRLSVPARKRCPG